MFSGTPVKAVKVPEDGGPAVSTGPKAGSIIGEVTDVPKKIDATPPATGPEAMRVLVAEDDLVNSKIVKKRLEKLGHNICLTINGEECADAFCEKPEDFDVLLMDMQVSWTSKSRLRCMLTILTQMPIVNGMTSCKMIRSYEKTHPNILSPRAAGCGRLPIIAVSASLLEKSRQAYIDAGFDAWILKPISFPRLTELMAAIVDPVVRGKCAYVPGQWERGGWFHDGWKSAEEASTVPSGEPPQANPSQELEAAVRSDGPMVDSETGSVADEQAGEDKRNEQTVDPEVPGTETAGLATDDT
jgi:CheY-like chemotaxis protein